MLKRKVNGVDVELSPAEEAAIRAEWAQNEQAEQARQQAEQARQAQIASDRAAIASVLGLPVERIVDALKGD